MSSRRRKLLLALSALGVLLVALLDYLTGERVALSFFYMVPVIIVTWLSQRTVGVLLALVCAGLFPLADVLSGSSPEWWVVFWNFCVRGATLVTVVSLVHRLKKALLHERELARTDPLTGTTNPRWFRELTERELDRLARKDIPLSLVFVDVDNFKTVNDEYGHDKGDELLMVIGELLRRSTRPLDIIGRLGGDEFAMTMPDTGFDAACRAVERIRRGFDTELEVAQMPEVTSLSLGVVTVNRQPESLDVLLFIADQLMYAAKRAGKNQMRGKDLTNQSVGIREGSAFDKGVALA